MLLLDPWNGDDIGELEKSQGQKNIGTNQSGQGQGQQVNERGVFGLGNKEDWKEVMRQPGHLPSPPLRDSFPILGGTGTSPGFAAKYLHLPERRRRHSGSFTFCQFSSGWGPLAADPIILFVQPLYLWSSPSPHMFRGRFGPPNSIPYVSSSV